MLKTIFFALLATSYVGFAMADRPYVDRTVISQADADVQLAGAVAKAKAENKKVFLRFSAVWCGHCIHMQQILDRPNMKTIFGGEFVDLKIDIEKTPKGRALYLKYAKNGDGVPWFAFLNDTGAILSSSVGPHGNIGCPATAEEIAFFVNNLRNATKLSAEQLEQVEAAFKN